MTSVESLELIESESGSDANMSQLSGSAPSDATPEQYLPHATVETVGHPLDPLSPDEVRPFL